MAKHYAATSLTGGGSGALDKINGALLSDGDTARVTIKDTGRTWFFHLDAQSGLAESPPEVIAPDSGAEAKRWILSRLAVDASTLGTAAVNDMASSEEGRAGQASDKVMSPAASKAAFDSWVAGKTSLPRQAILTGKVVDGLPAFLSVSGNDVQVLASEAEPLILSFAAGFEAQGGIDYFARLTDHRTIANSELARGVRNYVFAERDPDTGAVRCGVTDVPPEYNWKREGMDILTAHTTYAGAYGTISASSEHNATWPAWKAVDRLTNVSGTAWITVSGTTTGWLRYVLGTPKPLAGYKLCGRNSVLAANSEPKDWTVRVGADAVPDVLADTRSGQTGWTANEYRTFMLPAPLACKSFELNIAANAGYTTYTQIDEFVPLFSEDFFDLNTYTMHGPDGSLRQRVYLGFADVSAAGVVTTARGYALGDLAVRNVNNGANLAANLRYVEENPFGAGAPVQVGVDIYVAGDWGDPHWNVYYEGGWSVRGVKASSFRQDILVVAGLSGLCLGGVYSGSPFTNGVSITSAPARIRCRRAF
ncbi:discoidin domain-containing protein [Desulfocurvibacter africanus]|uniref:F5/8 type C domain-containing protein n=2 Tax=Desulfocurvibacter africanus TaxID=873 RepID=F3YXF2_DESAF|nr:discoidin domain-containing protein [Desulfocurvibacter africanus]EGJ51729.1 hypothetical protein Desaf_3443 [Desulfocurvibacter africanus subsp. africanus str. Walvis Bay]